jgi:hypothetical protein
MSVDAAIRRLKMLPIALLGLAALGACAAPASDEAVADPNAAEPHVAALSAAFEEAWNNDNPAALTAMNAPDPVSYTNGVQDTLSIEEFITGTKQMYPDGRVQVQDAFAVGDRIITHWTWSATAAPSRVEATLQGLRALGFVAGGSRAPALDSRVRAR